MGINQDLRHRQCCRSLSGLCFHNFCSSILSSLGKSLDIFIWQIGFWCGLLKQSLKLAKSPSTIEQQTRFYKKKIILSNIQWKRYNSIEEIMREIEGLSTWENSGRIVMPAWPPITGTLTSANKYKNSGQQRSYTHTHTHI